MLFALPVDSDSEPKCLWKYNQVSSAPLTSLARMEIRCPLGSRPPLSAPPHTAPGPNFARASPRHWPGFSASPAPAALVGSSLLIFLPAWLLFWMELNLGFSSPSPPPLKFKLNDNTVMGKKSLSSSDAPFYLDSSPTWSDEQW